MSGVEIVIVLAVLYWLTQ